MAAQNQSTNIGVIGLGIMGAAMARNLLKAGYQVGVYNRTISKAQELAEAGARIASCPKELARQSDLVLIMVSNPEAVWEVCRGAEGLLAADGQGKVLMQHSTINLETTLTLAKEAGSAGYQFLDCPVTGSKKQVEAAELIFEAGGDPALIERVKPVLLAMGKHIIAAGEVGAGTALKLCLNLIVAQMTTGLCESAALARALGVDPGHIFEALGASPALNCLYYQIKKDALLNRNYAPAFSLTNMLKDVRFMNAESAAAGLDLPVTKAVQELMEAALAKGFGDQDLTAMAELLNDF